MLRNILSSLLLTVAAINLACLSGCGSDVKPVKSAAKRISAAQQALEYAKACQARGDYDTALERLKDAEEEIKDGQKFAVNLDAKALRNLQSSLDDLQIALNMQKTAQKKPEAAKQAVAEAEDPAAAAKREAEEKKKKDAAAAEQKKLDLEKQLALAPKAASTAKKEDDDTGAAAKTGGGDKTKADNPGAENTPPAPERIGPFPLVTADSPDLEVVKLAYKGQYVLAYFQIYNKGDKGKRIAGISVYFKDKDSQVLIPEKTVIVFPFKGFSDTKKDLTEQLVDGITMNSFAVEGDASMQFVAVGEGQRAADVRKVGVRVGYNDGSSAATVGPANPANVQGNDVMLKLK